jgi:hypothetical protein
MSIIRSPRPESHFGVYSNDVVRDNRLSYKARGILLELLSRPDNWRVSADALAVEGPDGRDSIIAGLKELRDAGYIITTRVQNEKGHWSTESVVFDIPQPKPGLPESEKPKSGEPRVGQPKAGLPKLENPVVIEELFKEELYKEELIKKKDKEIAQTDFDKFWFAYPRKTGKGAAVKAFATAMKKTNLTEIIDGINILTSDPHFDMEFCPYPATWLNQERWCDEAVVYERKVANTTTKVQDFLALYSDNGPKAITSERQK